MKLFLCILLLVLLSGCGIFKKEERPTVQIVEKPILVKPDPKQIDKCFATSDPVLLEKRKSILFDVEQFALADQETRIAMLNQSLDAHLTILEMCDLQWVELQKWYIRQEQIYTAPKPVAK